MKKCLIIVAALLLGLNSCDYNSTEPIQDDSLGSKLRVIVRSKAHLEALQLDSIVADAELSYYGGKSYRSTMWISDDARVEALLADDNRGVHASQVRFRGIDLTESIPGLYSSMDAAVYTDGPSSDWYILDYDGGDLIDTTEHIREITFQKVVVGDSLSASSGFTIHYAGASGGDLNVLLVFDYSHTEAWGDTALARNENTGGFLRKTVVDDGTIEFSQEELADFTRGVYVRLSVDHWSTHFTRSTRGRLAKIHKYHNSDIPLFLTD